MYIVELHIYLTHLVITSPCYLSLQIHCYGHQSNLRAVLGQGLQIFLEPECQQGEIIVLKDFYAGSKNKSIHCRSESTDLNRHQQSVAHTQKTTVSLNWTDKEKAWGFTPTVLEELTVCLELTGSLQGCHVTSLLT